MKVICQGNELSDALSKVVKALPVKTTSPILNGIKISAYGDTLTLFATDLELAIEKKINAKVLIEGEIVVLGKLFTEYAKTIEKEEIELDGSDESKLVIKYLDSVININCLSVDEYPVIKDVNKDSSFVITKKSLKNIISKVAYSVATDEARPSLRGICFNVKEDQIESVASDSYRLALCKSTIKNNGFIGKIVIPAKSMMELSRLIDDEDETITIYVENNYLMVDFFHTKIITRLIAENYINYEKIIPSISTTTVTIDKTLFKEAIDRVSIINRADKKSIVKMEFREDIVTLNANGESGEINEKIVIKLEGKDLTIGFNPKYLTDFINAIDDEFIKLSFTSSTAAGIITSDTGEWLYLVLPLRVIG